MLRGRQLLRDQAGVANVLRLRSATTHRSTWRSVPEQPLCGNNKLVRPSAREESSVGYRKVRTSKFGSMTVETRRERFFRLKLVLTRKDPPD